MANVVFFSFKEADREPVLLIKGRAMNSQYPALDFRVHDLLARWDTTDPSAIRQAITKSIKGSSRTIVFVGENTYLSRWVPEEVEMTLDQGKPVYAIRLSGTSGTKPKCLTDNGVYLYSWSEARLQELATI
ncbi:MAG: TIR domain-containing protein [bacterium]|nr:TIR domain-containing protein [bacterium]